MLGTCRLCQQLNCDLQMSHLLPAAGYERLRKSGDPRRHPVVINAEVTYEASWQAQDYLLCRKCEQLGNSKGEDWILRNCWMKVDEFPLHANLVAAAPVTTTPDVKTFHAGALSEINVDRIVYFAASVFWRASAHAWPIGRNTTQDAGILGPYEERFRKYLLAEKGFPENCALWVMVAENNTPAVFSMLAPYRGPIRSWHTYKFVFLGIGFELFVGRAIPQDYREMCFVRGAGNPIYMSDRFSDRIVGEMWMSIQRTRNLIKK